MKKIIITLALTLLTIAGAVAQVPQGFNYQAVVRNAQGELVTDATVGVRISLLQGSADGRTVYTETQTPQTNAGGLFTIVIGQGDATTGSFAAIDWAEGPYFINSEVDPEGGNNYTVSSVQQLLSVPYAMFAGSAANAGDVTRAYVDSAVAAIEVPAAGVTQGYVDSAIAAISLTGGANVVYDGVRDTVVCGGYEDGWYGTESYFDLYVEAGIMHFYQMNYTVIRPEYHDTTVMTDSSSYVWHGDTYTASGSYYWYGNTADECVVEQLNLVLNASSQTNVTVNFNGNTWNSQYAEGYYQGGADAYFAIEVASDPHYSSYPIAIAYTDGIGTGSHTVSYGEYYMNNVYQNNNGDVFGDWISYGNTGNATFTLFDTVNNTASGTMTITLYSLDDYTENWDNGNQIEVNQCISSQLTITFNNLHMTRFDTEDTTSTVDTTTVNPNPGVDTLSNVTITITFGDTLYNPDLADAVYFPEYGIIGIEIVATIENGEYNLPYSVIYFNATTGTSTVENTMVQGNVLAPEYYESTSYQSGNYYYADWQYYGNGTYTITAIDFTAGTISGTYSATMYSLTDIVNDTTLTPDSATHRQLSVEFTNIPMTTYGNSSSVAPTARPASMYRSDIAMPRTVTPRRANLNF